MSSNRRGIHALSTRGEWLITAGGLGRCRPASGTWGSLPPAAVALWLIACREGLGVDGWAWTACYLAVMGALGALGCAACIVHGDAAEVRFLKKDPGQVVADEVAGMALTLLPVPWLLSGTESETVAHAAVWILLPAFVLFRVADIAKVWPARQVQRVPAGWGILLDDLIAGAQALGALLVWSAVAG